jgi:hypothetical protein
VRAFSSLATLRSVEPVLAPDTHRARLESALEPNGGSREVQSPAWTAPLILDSAGGFADTEDASHAKESMVRRPVVENGKP